MISASDALAALMSEKCACGAVKEAQRSFCGACYRLLPAHMKSALYLAIGKGYERAYDEAKRCIAAKRQKADEVGAGRFTRIDYRRR